MNFSFAGGDPARAKADVLIIPVFDNELSDKKKQAAAVTSADKKLKGLLLKTALQEGFKGKGEQLLTLHTHGKLGSARVVLVGLGSRVKFNNEVLRLAAGRAVKAANRLRSKTAVVALPVLREHESAVRAIVEGFELGAYRYDRWRTTNKDEKNAQRVEKVALVLPEGVKKEKALDGAIALGRRVAEATNWAKDLVNEPAGTLTPTALANAAKQMATDAGLGIEVLGRKEIEKLKMGMFLGVTQGSVEEPKLLHVSYVPDDVEG